MRDWHYIAAAVGIIGGVAVCTGTASAGLRTSTEHVLQDASRSICRGLSLSCRKKTRKAKTTASQNRAPVKRPAVKPKAKPAIKAPVQPEEESKPAPRRESPPLPEKKPQNSQDAGTPAPAPPLPREKPATAEKQITVEPAPKPEAPKPEMAKPEVPKPPQVQSPPPVVTAIPPAQANSGADCHSRLVALGASFEAVANSIGSGQCSIADPVKLASLKLPTRSIGFPDGPILACEFAVKFIEWLKDTGAPIVEAQANSPVAQLWTGPGYECRGRNGDAGAKISEHGFGNAVDITNFKLADGRMFEVKDALNTQSPAYATLKGLRGSACGYFTTVLGPGANVAHETHFHFDLGKHGASENYKICE